MYSQRHRTLIAFVLVLACTEDNPLTGDSSTSDTVGPETSNTVGSATMATTGPTNTTDPTATDATDASQTDASQTDATDSADTSAGSTEDGGRLCGNGQMDDGEACDDGDAINGNGCNNDCVASGTVLWELDVSGEYLPLAIGLGGGDRVAVDGDGAAYAMFQTQAAEYFAVVRKVDAQGEIAWTILAEHESASLGLLSYAIAATAEGEFALAGFLQGDQDVFVNRYGANGTITWSRTLDLAQQYIGRSVAIDDAGEVIVVGGSELPVVSAFAAKFDENGTQNWVEEFVPVDGFASFFGVAAAPGGELVIVGSAGAPGIEGWVRRYTADAVEIWTSTHAGVTANYEDGTAVAITPDGGAVVVACVYANIWVRKFAPDGDLEWTETYNGDVDGQDVPFGVATFANGDVVVVGWEEAESFTDAWVGRFAGADGAVLWERSWNGPAGEQDSANGVAVAPNGDILVTAMLDNETSVRLYRLAE
jgi:cysteine-rich repeat protein